MKGLSSKIFLFFIIIILAAQLASVAEATAKDERQQLKERAEEFWKARVKGDWATVYDYLSDEDKNHLTREQFVSISREKGPFRFVSFTLGDVETADKGGWVEVSSSTTMVPYPDLPPKQKKAWQVWHKREDGWYPLPMEREAELPRLPPRLRSVEEEKALTSRADQFWAAREMEDWKLIYRFLDPSFREGVSEEDWLSKKARYLYLSHRIEWAEVVGLRGRVRVTISYTLNDPTLTKLEPMWLGLVEDWIKVNGLWYQKMKKKEK